MPRCALYKKADNLYVEAYYLLGVLLYKIGDFEGAEDEFRKVTYIDPGIVIAYLNLGDTHLYRKKSGKAVKEFAVPVKLPEKMTGEAGMRFHEDFTAGSLLLAAEKNLVEAEIC